MPQAKIKLFVMHGCQVCPQMERLFRNMHQNGYISKLEVLDVQNNPELAEQYQIRSVPFYLINETAFYGLKSETEIKKLIAQDDSERWMERIRSELTTGQLDTVEKFISQQPLARDAMLLLLADVETSLVVRIGLSAVIESMAGSEELKQYEDQFTAMSQHQDERIAIDALYYLSLLGTSSSIEALKNFSKQGSPKLREHAAEILDELVSE